MLATVPARGAVVRGDGPEIRVVPGIDAVVALLESGRLVAAAVDIPIGLPTDEPRRCDLEARRLLGPRRASVFPAPVRAALDAGTYAETCDVSQKISGKALSIQLYNILGKIREVDAFQSPSLQRRLFEACPELSFAVMARGVPMGHNKRSADGRAERIAVLHEHVGVDVPALLEARAPGAQPDDVLDALALAWTARRCLGGSCLRLGGELDATGLRMEIVA